ncbi:MAG: MBL fold metallo-hydrolase [Archaeoglobaceae archaeon]|nr:MBL fold metallo-hydrolase [Archaeoglobaceae archaeon]MCX8152304.1 MBL fold metallo-hydrolase [Archaeoglobaceae archaeon]MDW8013982.1 MBL fold metallo-hydrolase [Archaeoglobaceae archaeon]
MKLRSRGCNVYLLESEKHAYLIDTGTDAEVVVKQIGELDGIVITHAHFDHFAAAYKIQRHFGCPVYIHPEDEPFILGEKEFIYSGFLGFIAKTFEKLFKFRPPENVKNVFELKDLEIVHSPGHTPGSICILKDEKLFCGDLLRGNDKLKLSLKNFCYNYEEYLRSVKMIINYNFKIILPGHGKITKRAKLEELLEKIP